MRSSSNNRHNRNTAPPETPLQLLDEFSNRRVMVIGDAILDHYIFGEVTRTSPEAPVPVLCVEQEEWLPGGAANVARNLAAQDASVVFISVGGDDDSGTMLKQLLDDDTRIQFEFVRVKGRITPLKTRCVAQGQQMLRVDREKPTPFEKQIEDRLFARLSKYLPKVDGIILSDYGKGLLSPSLIARIIKAAEDRGTEVIVDPKGSEYAKYKGASIITPNKKEAQEASGVPITDDASAAEAARVLQRQIRGEAICITLGAGGVTVFPRRGNSVHAHARAREVFDVTGAGDTFISLFALARFSGASFKAAAEMANTAAGIVVGMSGVATISRDRLRQELDIQKGLRKLATITELTEIRKSLKRAKRKVVFTNGCFDVLNVRHIRLLEQAGALGDVLVVGLNDDNSVRRVKGAPRPLLSLTERVEMISALPYVDYVTVYSEDTPEKVLRSIKPDVLVKGDNVPEVVGRMIVEGYGGEVHLINLGIGLSAEDLIQRAAISKEPVVKRKKK